jgi:hypothetical protein
VPKTLAVTGVRIPEIVALRGTGMIVGIDSDVVTSIAMTQVPAAVAPTSTLAVAAGPATLVAQVTEGEDGVALTIVNVMAPGKNVVIVAVPGMLYEPRYEIVRFARNVSPTCTLYAIWSNAAVGGVGAVTVTVVEAGERVPGTEARSCIGRAGGARGVAATSSVTVHVPGPVAPTVPVTGKPGNGVVAEHVTAGSEAMALATVKLNPAGKRLSIDRGPFGNAPG